MRGGGIGGGLFGFPFGRLRGPFPPGFLVSFPVATIDGLGQHAELTKGVGFPDMENFVLHSGWKSTVELVSESSAVSTGDRR